MGMSNTVKLVTLGGIESIQVNGATQVGVLAAEKGFSDSCVIKINGKIAQPSTVLVDGDRIILTENQKGGKA